MGPQRTKANPPCPAVARCIGAPLMECSSPFGLMGDSMTEASFGDVEEMWRRVDRGDGLALEGLLSRYYEEFRAVARRVLGKEGPIAPLQATDLAHEAALKLMRMDRMDVRGRTHFLSLSARVIRQTLIDEVRRRRALKRSAPPVTAHWVEPAAPVQVIDVEALDDALKRLEVVDADLAQIVEKRFFGGLTIEDIAVESGRSTRTVKRRWQAARAWLMSDLELA